MCIGLLRSSLQLVLELPTKPIQRTSCATKWLLEVIVVHDLTIRINTLLVAKVVTSLVNVWQTLQNLSGLAP